MLDTITITNKLDGMRSYLSELQPLLVHDNEAIKNDLTFLRSIERLLQLIVDAAIDINTSIIASMELEGPDDYAGTFVIASRSGAFPVDFAEKISKSVGLRNAVVHKYEKVTVDRMLNDIKQNIGDYIEYIKFIKGFLDEKKQ